MVVPVSNAITVVGDILEKIGKYFSCVHASSPHNSLSVFSNDRLSNIFGCGGVFSVTVFDITVAGLEALLRGGGLFSFIMVYLLYYNRRLKGGF